MGMPALSNLKLINVTYYFIAGKANSQPLGRVTISIKFRGRSVANRFHIIICSIRAPFSVPRFVISGGYYRSSFESVIESIVR